MNQPTLEFKVWNSNNLDEPIQFLNQGEPVGIPTETVYGLAANAFDAKAVSKIFIAKERPTFDPLIVHIAKPSNSTTFNANLQALIDSETIDWNALLTKQQETCKKLIDAFWPGPMTLILPRSKKIPDLVTSGLETVGVRMPSHPDCQKLLMRISFPLAAPSANRFGRISPTSAKHVEAELSGRIPGVIEGGTSKIGLESTILWIENEGNLKILRPGAITREQIEKTTKVEVGYTLREGEKLGPNVAPGLMASHYSPSKSLFLLPKNWRSCSPSDVKLDPKNSKKSAGVLLFSSELPPSWKAYFEETHTLLYPLTHAPLLQLTSSEVLQKAATEFFSQLRALDESTAELLWAEQCPSLDGIGSAIADRLNKAAHPKKN